MSSTPERSLTEKPKHTPGPWVLAFEGVDDEDNDLSEVRAACHEHPNCHKTIMFVRGPDRPPQCSYGENTEANARLIAAAPELLTALRELRGDANRLCDRNLGGTYEEDCRRSIALADAAIAKAAGR